MTKTVDLTFVKYCIVGIFVTAVDFLVFSVAFYHLSFPSSMAKFIALCTAAAVSFILNRVWTFRTKDNRFFRLMVRFGAVASVGVLLSLGLIVLLVDLFSIHPLVVNAATSCAVLTWNFPANKYRTFRVWRGARATVRHEWDGAGPRLIDFHREQLMIHSIRP